MDLKEGHLSCWMAFSSKQEKNEFTRGQGVNRIQQPWNTYVSAQAECHVQINNKPQAKCLEVGSDCHGVTCAGLWYCTGKIIGCQQVGWVANRHRERTIQARPRMINLKRGNPCISNSPRRYKEYQTQDVQKERAIIRAKS